MKTERVLVAGNSKPFGLIDDLGLPHLDAFANLPA